ncbi:MAG: GspE/PulE family protein [Candidatus Magasanikbacteria bacterium]
MFLSSDKLAEILVEERIATKEEMDEYKEQAKQEDQHLYHFLIEQGEIDKDELGKAIANQEDIEYIDISSQDIDSSIVKNIPEVVARKNNAIVFSESESSVKVALFDPTSEDFIENIKNKIQERTQRIIEMQDKADKEERSSLANKNKDELLDYAKQEYDISLDKENTKQEMLDNFLDQLNEIKDKEAQEKEIEIYFGHKQDIQDAVHENYDSSQEDFAAMVQDIIDNQGEDINPEDMPIIKIVNELLQYAYENNASDIHIEPYEEKTLIRFRIDGILHDIISIPKSLHNLIITRIKILARLRTDEHRTAQDGKLRFNHEGEEVDVRVSIVPIVYGEKAVLRILAETTGKFTLDNLGFRDQDLEKIKDNIDSPWGMILATGPTGSGKTTTLYTVLKKLNSREVNISTIEDPVEYGIESINQIQVNEEANLTFSNGLRAIVRQDPDIIMVGEIRDEETAQIAVNAAMTGHLVLSTLHTNDSATTLPRLLDMGVQPFLVASTLNVVIAQRLVRKICEHCKGNKEIDEETKELITSELSEDVIDEYDLLDADLKEGKGCASCQQSGYQGRVGIYEVLDVSQKIKQMVMDKKNADDIKQQAIEEGMLPLIKAGIEKVLDGQTTLEELLRVAQE